jgi:hypothetical protein
MLSFFLSKIMLDLSRPPEGPSFFQMESKLNILCAQLIVYLFANLAKIGYELKSVCLNSFLYLSNDTKHLKGCEGIASIIFLALSRLFFCLVLRCLFHFV